MMLCTSDIYVLITYASFVESFFIMLSIASLLHLRWKKPDLERPIKVFIRVIMIDAKFTLQLYTFKVLLFQVSIFVPVIYVIVALFLVVLPCYVKPLEVGFGVLITLTGIPVYYIFVCEKYNPQWLQQAVS